MDKDIEKTTEQAAIFDECVSELSAEAQKELGALVAYIADKLAFGAGEKSAKALIIQSLRYLNKERMSLIHTKVLLQSTLKNV